MKRVYLCKGDESGWAVDEDRRLTAAALEGVVQLVDNPRDADAIHACWWMPLMRLPHDAVADKPVICHMIGDPARCMGEPPLLAAMQRVTHWIAMSRGSLDKLRVLAPRVQLIPYAVDTHTFGPDAAPDPAFASTLSTALASVPPTSYLIANFHRDTAGPAATPGSSQTLTVPKLVKGPDLFLEILALLTRRGQPVTALLAGPRRHWLRHRLRERNIPFLFLGHATDTDDYPANIISRAQLAHLYRAANLCLVTSRSEGGPHSILEAAAANCPQLSTPVGIAPDILHHDCLFTDPVEAVEKTEADIASGFLRRHTAAHRATIHAAHTIDANRERWQAFYSTLNTSPSRPTITITIPDRAPVPALTAKPRRVSFWNKFTPPPWGGGNQFMMALKAAADKLGYETTVNGEGINGEGPFADNPAATAHIINSVQFDIDKFRATVAPGSARVIHRIDGPISVLRGTPESADLDALCFDLNRQYASATVIQSWHTVRALAELGFKPVRPALIINACDPTIFSPPATPRPLGHRLKVVASAWSPNPGKGAMTYRWMDENLDPDRFEFTFVGNLPVKLKHARVVPPMPSEELADFLREHDVYITASRNDPCSNAVIEALACGLPTVYYDSGGHPELVGFGGLPFSRPDQIPGLLDRLRDNIETYRHVIAPTSIQDVCERYMALLFSNAAYKV